MIPEEVLSQAFSDQLGEQYNASRKRFYELRAARNIVSSVKRGRPFVVDMNKLTKANVARAHGDGGIAKSTVAKWKQLLATTSGPDRARSRLQLIYHVLPGGMNGFLCFFVLCYGFTRESLRIGIDPLVSNIQLELPFSAKQYRRTIAIRNYAVRSKPSIHQAFFGMAGQELESSLHWHNWFTVDDAWHHALTRCVAKWDAWGLDANLQWQLISFACVYNSANVAALLEGCTSRGQLLIKSGELIPEAWGACLAFPNRSC